MTYMRRLCPTWVHVPFSAFRYLKGQRFHKLSYAAINSEEICHLDERGIEKVKPEFRLTCMYMYLLVMLDQWPPVILFINFIPRVYM